MYEYIRGLCVDTRPDALILEANGIGYRIRWVGTETLPRGETVQVYVHFQVKEDAQELFGFPSPEDREIFRLLLDVKNIGPKVAQQILSTLTPAALAAAVLRKDTAALTRVKGLGKKGAERILVELKDKLQRPADEGEGLPPDAAVPAETPLRRSVADALRVLGFSPAEAEACLETAFDPALDLEENIRLALKHLQRR